MDVILSVADDYVLDSVWAWALPALPRSLSGVDTSPAFRSAGAGSSSKAASPSSSAISNLTASLASAWASRSASGSPSEGVAERVMNATADWESLKGVSAWGRDHMLR